MCMLCGALSMGRHWAEKDRDAPLRRRERRVRIRLLNRVLGHYGMNAKLWDRGYMLGLSAGPSIRAETLGNLWLEVERVSGRRCDPLDPVLIASLSRASTTQS